MTGHGSETATKPAGTTGGENVLNPVEGGDDPGATIGAARKPSHVEGIEPIDADDPLLTEAEAARVFPPRGIAKRTLIRYRADRKIAYVRIAGRIYYRTSDIRDCIELFRVAPKQR